MVVAIPAFHKDARILFQGDSITDASRGESSDSKHALGNGYVSIIAGRYRSAFPELNLTFLNCGVSGNTVLDLARRWRQDTLDLNPDVLSVLIGVNDAGKGVPLDRYEQVYDKLLADVRAANPAVRIVLCAPFMQVGQQKEILEQLTADVKARQEIVAKLSQKYRAALVRFQPVFDAACQKAPAEHWLSDGVHPTHSGHELMADEWVRTVREFRPAQ